MQNGLLIMESRTICTILLQDLMKRGVCQCGVEMLLASEYPAVCPWIVCYNKGPQGAHAQLHSNIQIAVTEGHVLSTSLH